MRNDPLERLAIPGCKVEYYKLPNGETGGVLDVICGDEAGIGSEPIPSFGEWVSNIADQLECGRQYAVTSNYHDYKAFQVAILYPLGAYRGVAEQTAKMMRRHKWWKFSLAVKENRNALFVTLFRSTHITTGHR